MTALASKLTYLKEATLDLLFPRRCVGCGRMGEFICLGCRRKLPRLAPPLCPKCGKPQSSGLLCANCWREPSKLDGIRSVCPFDGVMRQAIYELKYHNLKAISDTLAELLADYLKVNPLPGEVLIPVPLHPKRLKERGYNHSSLLSRELGKLIDLTVVDNCLVRLKHSLPQARAATVTERRRNVADAFFCRDERLKGKKVLLIDDVCTSGATLEACAVALKDGGATSVWGLTLAREM